MSKVELLPPRLRKILNLVKELGPVDYIEMSQASELNEYYCRCMLRELTDLGLIYISHYALTLAHPRPYYSIRKKSEKNAPKPTHRINKGANGNFYTDKLPEKNPRYGFWGI